MGIAEWKRLFDEANSLGLSKLTISGGEPTLYRDLLELIALGKAYGWEVGLNTNGSLIDRDLVMQLKEAGLDLVTLSLCSATPEFHDRPSFCTHRPHEDKMRRGAELFCREFKSITK